MFIDWGVVEPHPEPMNKIFDDEWTRDASRSLWPNIAAIEITMATWVKRLLKYFDPRSKVGSLVFSSVNVVLVKSLNELEQQYYPYHEGSITQDMRWECVRKNLDRGFPSLRP